MVRHTPRSGIPHIVWAALALIGTLLPHTADAATIPFFSAYPTINENQWHLSNGWANGEHQSCEWRREDVYGEDNNLQMRLSDNGGSVRPYGCAEIQSATTNSYGLYEAQMRTAAGNGLNTAFFTFTGGPLGGAEHDEIDFEFLGKDPHTVQLNYHTSFGGKHEVIVQLGFDASKEFHTYAFSWQPDKIQWFVDGKKVSETPAGAHIPKNPGLIIFSLWSGSKMLDQWLAPFVYNGPVTADVSWVKFTPYK
jgi:endo-1,3-1,4-beta-glycanase ExoK